MAEKKLTFEDIKTWCKEHEYELIIGGVVSAGIVGGIFLRKRHLKLKMEREALDKEGLEILRALEGLKEDTPTYPYALPDPAIMRSGYNYNGGIVCTSNREEITKAVMDNLNKLLDNVDPANIQRVSMLYDIK